MIHIPPRNKYFALHNDISNDYTIIVCLTDFKSEISKFMLQHKEIICSTKEGFSIIIIIR